MPTDDRTAAVLTASERESIEAVLIEASRRFNFDDPPTCRESFALARMVTAERQAHAETKAAWMKYIAEELVARDAAAADVTRLSDDLTRLWQATRHLPGGEEITGNPRNIVDVVLAKVGRLQKALAAALEQADLDKESREISERYNRALEAKLADATQFCSGDWPCEASTAAASLERERNDLEAERDTLQAALADADAQHDAAMSIAAAAEQARVEAAERRAEEAAALLGQAEKALELADDYVTDHPCEAWHEVKATYNCEANRTAITETLDTLHTHGIGGGKEKEG